MNTRATKGNIWGEECTKRERESEEKKLPGPVGSGPSRRQAGRPTNPRCCAFNKSPRQTAAGLFRASHQQPFPFRVVGPPLLLLLWASLPSASASATAMAAVDVDCAVPTKLEGLLGPTPPCHHAGPQATKERDESSSPSITITDSPNFLGASLVECDENNETQQRRRRTDPRSNGESK